MTDYHVHYDKTKTLVQPGDLEKAREYYGHMDPAYTPKQPKMDPEVKANWIRALREPDRKQTKGYLELESEGEKWQCCLGVLCEVQGLTRELKNTEAWLDDQTVVEYQYDFSGRGDNSSRVLSGHYARTLGLLDQNVTFWVSFTMFGEKFHQEYTLINLNDNGFTFGEIADIIEYFF